MADPRPRRRLALSAVWVGGTLLAMAASILAINVAGTKVTSPASFSTAHIGQAADISGTATTLGSTSGTGSPAGAAATGSSPDAGTTNGAGGQGATGTTVGPGGSASPGSATPTTAGASGGAGPGSTTTTVGSSPPTTGSPVTTQAPPPSSVKSVTVTGGTVRVQCIGDTATLLADPPDAGFAVQASHPSASTVDVEFDKGNVSSEVIAVCANGVITFHTETSTDG
jgi:hypothetical protein